MSLDTSLRAQAVLHDRWLTERLATVLPGLMDQAGLDCWVVCCREYAEDPVLASLMPAAWLSARRRTVLVLARDASGVTGHAVARYGVEGLYASVWDGRGAQALALRGLLDDLAQRAVGVDVSATFAHADGLSVTDHAWLTDALGPHAERVVSAETLAVGWLQARLPDEVAAARRANALAHEVIAEAFSRSVLTPGSTTCDDLVWWVRQRFADLSVPAWFQPTVDAQRHGAAGVAPHEPVLAGDLLHCDVGLTFAGLCTDTQELAYVLRPGESAAPPGLVSGLRVAAGAQDVVTDELRERRTGNAVLASARRRLESMGVDALVYSHPVGRHGHGAGAYVGLWDHQDGVPGSGEAVVRADTLWALELGVRVAVPEWGGQQVYVGVEQGVTLGAAGVDYLDGRQDALHLV